MPPADAEEEEEEDEDDGWEEADDGVAWGCAPTGLGSCCIAGPRPDLRVLVAAAAAAAATAAALMAPGLCAAESMSGRCGPGWLLIGRALPCTNFLCAER